MVTKLRNMIDFDHMSEKRRSIFLFLLILQESILITFVGIFSGYSRLYSIREKPHLSYTSGMKAAALAIIAVFLAVYLIRRGVDFLRRHPLDENIKPLRCDRINSEILVLVVLVTGVIWANISSFFTIYTGFALEGYSYQFSGLAGLWEGCIAAIKVLPVLIIFYVSIGILLRQWFRRIISETSFVLATIRRYKDRTPLEIKLMHRRRTSLALAIVAFIVGGIGVLVGLDYYEEWAVIAGMSLVVLFVLLFRIGLGRISRETGCLVQQIQCMTDGKELPQKYVLREKALLFEPSCQLKNIDSAMRKSVEKQIQAERLKIDLITNVSHDLKTPLTSMVGYTDLLKKEELSAEARDYVEIISAKQEQLKNMIQDLFELSKATNGTDQMVMETLDMRRLLQQTMGDMEDVIRASGREIRANFTERPLLFLGDNNKMYRVVQNLLENALKYSLEGTRIYLEAAHKGGQVEMQLKNIASYEMDFTPEEIMERFVRGDQARTTEGHGLGLAIASSFVHNMGGDLEIKIDGDLFKAIMRFPSAQVM